MPFLWPLQGLDNCVRSSPSDESLGNFRSSLTGLFPGARPEIQQRVRDLQEESAIVLSNQSKERALVGEVISTVALADQISREFSVSAVPTANYAKYAKGG